MQQLLSLKINVLNFFARFFFARSFYTLTSGKAFCGGAIFHLGECLSSLFICRLYFGVSPIFHNTAGRLFNISQLSTYKQTAVLLGLSFISILLIHTRSPFCLFPCFKSPFLSPLSSFFSIADIKLLNCSILNKRDSLTTFWGRKI